MIDWKENFDLYKKEEEDEDYKSDFNSDECIGVVFASEYGDDDFVKASFKDLENNLLDQVKQNKYKEVILHDGENTSTTYVYTLDHKLFV